MFAWFAFLISRSIRSVTTLSIAIELTKTVLRNGRQRALPCPGGEKRIESCRGETTSERAAPATEKAVCPRPNEEISDQA